jgi:hypothetical protein
MESVEPAPDGTRVVGRADNLTFWQNLANNRDGAFEVEDVVVFGDRANIRWRYRFGAGLSQSEVAPDMQIFAGGAARRIPVGMTGGGPTP